MNKIAAVILNYNSSADCAKCVASLKKQQDVELGIIIVDNCSAPDDRAAVEELCRRENCVFIANNENRGYNAGNNVGLRYASANSFEYALIANPDMEFPDVEFVKKLQDKNDFSRLMIMQEKLKTMPFSDVWEEYCKVCGVEADEEKWYAEVEKYEKEVLSKRN